MPIMLDSINGLSDGSDRQQREADPGFLIGAAQRPDTIEMRVETSRQGGDTALIIFPPKQEPAAVAPAGRDHQAAQASPGSVGS